jgi:hypothetical protein
LKADVLGRVRTPWERREQLERFKSSCGLTLKPDRKIPRGFGLRQPSTAILPQDRRRKSGRGLPQSKTLARNPINPSHLAGYGIFETTLASSQVTFNRRNQIIAAVTDRRYRVSQ